MSKLFEKQINQPLQLSGSFTGSFEGTASFAITASYALNGGGGGGIINTSSLVTTSSFYTFTSSYNTFSSSYNTGSFTGSFTGDGSGLTNLPTQSINTSIFVLTSSFYTFTQSYNQDSSSFSNNINALMNQTGSYVYTTQTSSMSVATASYVQNAKSASYWSGSITNSATASYVQNAVSASYWGGLPNVPNINTATGSLTILFDGQGGVISTGQKGGFITVPYNCTIIGWDIVSSNGTTGAAVVGSIVVDVWQDSFANFPPTVADTIFGTKPSLSSQSKNSATGLNISLIKDYKLGAYVDSCTTCTLVNLSFTIIKT